MAGMNHPDDGIFLDPVKNTKISSSDGQDESSWSEMDNEDKYAWNSNIALHYMNDCTA